MERGAPRLAARYRGEVCCSILLEEELSSSSLLLLSLLLFVIVIVLVLAIVLDIAPAVVDLPFEIQVLEDGHGSLGPQFFLRYLPANGRPLEIESFGNESVGLGRKDGVHDHKRVFFFGGSKGIQRRRRRIVVVVVVVVVQRGRNGGPAAIAIATATTTAGSIVVFLLNGDPVHATESCQQGGLAVLFHVPVVAWQHGQEGVFFSFRNGLDQIGTVGREKKDPPGPRRPLGVGLEGHQVVAVVAVVVVVVVVVVVAVVAQHGIEIVVLGNPKDGRPQVLKDFGAVGRQLREAPPRRWRCVCVRVRVGVSVCIRLYAVVIIRFGGTPVIPLFVVVVVVVVVTVVTVVAVEIVVVVVIAVIIMPTTLRVVFVFVFVLVVFGGEPLGWMQSQLQSQSQSRSQLCPLCWVRRRFLVLVCRTGF